MFKKFKLKVFIIIIPYLLLLIPLFQFNLILEYNLKFFGGVLGKVLLILYFFIPFWLIEKYYGKKYGVTKHTNLNKPFKKQLTIEKRIKFAFIIGMIIALIDLGYLILTLLKYNQFYYFQLLDVILILILSIGLLKKNRLSSVLLFTYFTFWKVVQLITIGVIFPGIFIAIFLVFILFDGMLATFQFHTSKKLKKA